MTSSENPGQAADSLITVAHRLETAVREPVNEIVLREAARDAVLAVEFHLDTVRASKGMGDQIARQEPRLLPELERLESRLTGLLTGLWTFQQQKGAIDDAVKGSIRALAADMRSTSERETDLLHEVQLAIGGSE